MKLLVNIILFLVITLPVFGQTDSTSVAADSLRNKPGQTTSDKIADQINEVSKAVTGLPVLGKTIEESPSVGDLISVSKVIWAIIFLVLGYFIIKWTSRILELFAERSTQYRISIKSFIPVVKILGWIGVVFLIIAGVFRPPMHTVLAFSASIGVAVGFASQDILKNIFGGIIILFDRPFQSGDKIEVGGFYGEVVEMGLRSTRIVTPDDNLVSIPNGDIMNSSVSNANAGESNCQVVTEFYLPVDTDTSKVRGIATEVAKVSKYVYLNKPITIIFVNEFKERSPIIKMKVKAYVLDIRDEFKFKSEVTELTLERLVEEKVIKVNY